MSRPTSYIGVSGFMSSAEVDGALDAFPDCGRQLMVGVLASGKTLAGQPNKYGRRYPNRKAIAGIFSDDPRCLNLVHVSLDHAEGADGMLGVAMRYGGPLCHGVQFNVPWQGTSRAVPVAILLFKRAWPNARLVLQLRSKSVVDLTVCAMEAYDAGATDVLIDASGGRGEPLRVTMAEVAVHQVRSIRPDLGIGIAGGLCAETVPGVAHLIRGGVSCDAEGRLRDDADGGGNLVQTKVEAYLRAVGDAVSR